MIPVNDMNERKYAEETLAAVKRCIDKELAHLKLRRENILEERKYFSDYFNELKEDEKKDLLDNELLDTNAYVYSLQLLTRLGKQLKEPYFAGFVFEEDAEEAEAERYYLSIHTLRDPETGAILTTDWRAPIASLYYESEPGAASFTAPAGKITGTLRNKRRYVFQDGRLVNYSDIGMPSDDEVLCEALRRNTDTHMKTILQTLQKEQYKIVRDYIEGVSVIQGKILHRAAQGGICSVYLPRQAERQRDDDPVAKQHFLGIYFFCFAGFGRGKCRTDSAGGRDPRRTERRRGIPLYRPSYAAGADLHRSGRKRRLQTPCFL